MSSPQVLVIGGSLNGLTTALLLAHHGVRVIVVERHAATTVQYKFAGISPRSMEIFRGLGIDGEIRARATRDQKSGEVARGKNLADPDLVFLGKPWANTGDLGGAPAATCDQDQLEPILRAHAERLGADIRFATELIALEHDDHGVRARVRTGDRDDEIHAAYAIAADGIAGKTRDRLGIARRGPGVLQHWMNLIFDTDLAPTVRGKPLTSCMVTDVNGALVPRGDRWLLGVPYDPARASPDDFDPARTAALVRRAVGRDDVKVELFDARGWTVIAGVAETFARGRVFLLGDAAHAMPPPGGFGGNTGIHDAHNLAWKLAAVLRGDAGASLLETYDVERRFVAEHTLAQALARLAAWFRDPAHRLPAPVPIVDDLHVIFGQRYPEGAFVPEPDAPTSPFDDPRQPTGRPGSRAPHVVVEHGGSARPVHELFDRRFTLLTCDPRWVPAAEAAHVVPIVVDTAAFPARYGVDAHGAALIRPDGFIAWRARTAVDDPITALRRALDHSVGSWTSRDAAHGA